MVESGAGCDVGMTRIVAILEPHCIAHDVERESMTFTGIHAPILSITAS